MALASFVSITACTPQGDPGIPASGFRDNFDRDALGELWNNTGAAWRLVDGQLTVKNAHNRPLWLRRKLPNNVRIEFDAKSDSPIGDIKAEIFGDGNSRATEDHYTATSYVILFGAWSNSWNGIARMDEHGDDRVKGTDMRVVPGQMYHLKIERVGNRLSYFVNDQKIAEFNDSSPLEGRGHDHFAFNDWETEVTFDNLVITPL